jgi:hypothetical protein
MQNEILLIVIDIFNEIKHKILLLNHIQQYYIFYMHEIEINIDMIQHENFSLKMMIE